MGPRRVGTHAGTRTRAHGAAAQGLLGARPGRGRRAVAVGVGLLAVTGSALELQIEQLVVWADLPLGKENLGGQQHRLHLREGEGVKLVGMDKPLLVAAVAPAGRDRVAVGAAVVAGLRALTEAAFGPRTGGARRTRSSPGPQQQALGSRAAPGEATGPS